MRVIGRLLVVLAVVLPLSVVVSEGVASANPALLKCMHWQDGMNISPGITNSPSDQVVSGHGRVFGCNKVGGSAQFTATLQMSGATCSNLSMQGSAQFDWANGTHSSAFLTFDPQSGSKVQIGGSISAGQYAGTIVLSQLRFTPVFNGSGASCSAGNPLTRIEFTNSRSLQLLGPTVTTTPPTLPPPNPPPSPPPTTPVIVRVHRPTQVIVIDRVPRRVFVLRRRRAILLVHRSFPTGTLAFTGSSGAAAAVGFLALLIGGSLACLDPERRQDFMQLGRRRPRKSLHVTLPRR